MYYYKDVSWFENLDTFRSKNVLSTFNYQRYLTIVTKLFKTAQVLIKVWPKQVHYFGKYCSKWEQTNQLTFWLLFKNYANNCELYFD